jgi:16S rRNA (uracil1498-N3)-methyltransferase
VTTDRALRDAVALVFVDDLSALQLADGDVHHLLEVLRIGAGEQIAVGDGRGAYQLCAVSVEAAPPDGDRSRPRRTPRRGARDLTLAPVGPPVTLPRAQPAITVGFGIPKGDRAEWTVQKLTEIGVDTIVPLLTDRTIVRLDAAEAARRGDRFRRVAREAASQSRRAYLPEVLDPCGLDALPEHVVAGAVFAEPGAGPIGTATTVLVGPEGGWSVEELARGLPAARLSDQILRAETAAIVAGVLLCAARGGIAELHGAVWE